MDLIWCEIDTQALENNMRAFRRLLADGVLLAPAVKANAYGHGLLLVAGAFLRGGADWLCVNALEELRTLREGGISAPVYVMGYVAREDLAETLSLGGRVVVYNLETVEGLADAARKTGAPARAHLKLETGNNRQGLPLDELLHLASVCRAKGVEVEGIATHFANVEDTTDHSFALEQLRRFHEGADALHNAGHVTLIRHLANSAATLLWPHAQLEMVRVGISAYGMWPSRETFVSAVRARRERVDLRPALTWKTRVAQVKVVPTGQFVGYGCTFKATHPTRLAVLPVGYYDGYDRKLSNIGHVLIRGIRAPIRGRVCMNMIMADVTDIPEVELEDEVVLLGRQGEEFISAEQMADWAGSINYEVVTRIGGHVSRLEKKA